MMTKNAFPIASGALLITLAAVLVAGCGSGGGNGIGEGGGTSTASKPFVIVADTENNRVLVYGSPLSTGQGANVVLGQAGFTSATAGTTATTMKAPVATAVDKDGNLYVAENGNCRVTQFKPPFTTGMSASLNVVIGQPDLVTGNCAATTSSTSLGNASGIDQVSGVAIDSSGNLWVADSGSNRVLEYQPPFSNRMMASVVIGQPGFMSSGAATTSTTLSDPVYPVFDSAGNLWISDFANSRLLQFKPPFVNGMSASLVLGQGDFVHGSSNQGGAVGQNTLSGPTAAAFDSAGNMWVPDSNNNRVLEFLPPFINNMNASLVLGQVDFSHGSSNQGGASPTAATLNSPHQVAFDSSGRLLVTDSSNNRTLVFVPPFVNGMSATLVLGQGTLTSSAAATTAAGQQFPTGVIIAP